MLKALASSANRKHLQSGEWQSEAQSGQLLAAFLTALLEVCQYHQSGPPHSVDQERHFDALSGRLAQFVYYSDTRHEHVFIANDTALGDASRVRLLLQKLDAAMCEKYASYILPKAPRDTTFAGIVG
ncbi:unnamed protein product [Toxocara canis]|uniref:UDENN domain-containing protein n=1 Tax=Toxocara canis TaxID=6265 RepID=A0A183UQN4_TOXCA|nr:unnamed protein product [Toxocara canis]